MNENMLGKDSPYSPTYKPEMLFAVARETNRAQLGIDTEAMQGVDIWNMWEASWLDTKGKPQVGCIELIYSASSPFLVESKSLKLYFNSLNQTAFNARDDFLQLIVKDLSALVGAPVSARFIEQMNESQDWQNNYQCIDDCEIEINHYEPIPQILADATETNSRELSERLCSHLFKTNCMVTGQPDWATVFIDYQGSKINREILLEYLISYRNHQAFHEPSAELIFQDLLKHCKPTSLSVYCRYTRRGGIDINPFRSTENKIPDNFRTLRQ